MAFQHEKRHARGILSGIEDGNLRASELRTLVDEADPALIYFIFGWIRAHYPADHPASDGVLGRLVELGTDNPALASKLKEGQADPLVEWFDDAYTYRDLKATAFIDLIVEKLEG